MPIPNYEPTSLDQSYKPFEREGWYKLVADKAEAGVSSGGFIQIKVVSLAEGGECDGNKVYHDIIFPPLDKAFNWDKNVETGEMFQDFAKPQFWMRRVGWTLQVYGLTVGINAAHTELVLFAKDGKEFPIRSEKVLKAMADKIAGQHSVGYVIPEPYNKTITDDAGMAKTVTRIKGKLKELRPASHVPVEGWADDYGLPMAQGFAPAPKATPAPPAPAPKPTMPSMADIEGDINLDEDNEFLD